jgi:hypothetical protein
MVNYFSAIAEMPDRHLHRSESAFYRKTFTAIVTDYRTAVSIHHQRYVHKTLIRPDISYIAYYRLT